MIHLFNLFLLANILIILAYLMSLSLFFMTKMFFSQQLKLNYIFLGMIGAALAFVFVMPGVPALKIEKTSHTLQVGVELKESPAVIKMGAKSAQHLQTSTSYTSIFLLSVLGLFLLWELSRLFKFIQTTSTYKKINHMHILLSDAIASPFSFWLPTRRYVVVPYEMATSTQKLRLSVAHEAQHHRQHDTEWIYVITFLRILFCINPFIHLWSRLIHQVQEFSCDETLVGRKNFSRGEYISCLVEVAENSLRMRGMSVSATGVSFVHGHNLKRRIEFMMNSKKKNQGWVRTAIAVSALVMCATAFAGKQIIKERELTPEMIKRMTKNTGVVINTEEAMGEISMILNDIANDPVKRQFIRDGIERYYQNKVTLDKALQSWGAPESLVGIGLIESGYQNFPPQNGDFKRSAGMWQIIQDTAKRLGLRVDPSVDERRDTELATSAAIRYLVMNRALFDSWDLSILAYNAGENSVAEAIKKTGSKNPWVVKKVLSRETQVYYVKWLAALLILQNPEIVQD